MANVKVPWIKVATDIFEDEKILLIESMPDSYAILMVWFKMLCFSGKQNNSGVFMMGNIPYTEKMLATIFRMEESTVKKALQTFQEFGMVEIVDGVITIPNWGKHQSLDAYEKRKQRDRQYQAERRAAQRAIAEQSADKSADASPDIAPLEEEKEKEVEVDIDKKSVREKTPTLFERLLPDFDISPILADKLREWFKYKTERKESYKEQGMKSLLRQIESNSSQYGDNAVVDLIEDSMANGWKGIIFDRLKQKPIQQRQQGTGGRRNAPPSGVDRLLEMVERGDFD